MTIIYSQTTIEGYLSLAITVCLVLQGADPTLLSPHVMQYIALTLGVLNAVNRSLQGDAGKTLAKVPGNPDPEIVPSHEIPNNPADKPILVK
jgi:hypothetical protein